MICSIILTQLLDLELKLALIGAVILPLPAILNFTLSELGKRKNNNLKRLITGSLLGLSIGIALFNLLDGNFVFGLIIILWILLLEFIVALVLQRANVLEKYIKQYEDAIYKD